MRGLDERRAFVVGEGLKRLPPGPGTTGQPRVNRLPMRLRQCHDGTPAVLGMFAAVENAFAAELADAVARATLDRLTTAPTRAAAGQLRADLEQLATDLEAHYTYEEAHLGLALDAA